ncbi:MAG: class I SAM-dependent methyltransferase [Candidatus Thorarchaeota archaeon]
MKINLDSIQQTLLIPLWSRAKLNQEDNPILVDLKASDIIKKIQYDFSKIDIYFPYFLHVMNLVRTKMFDSFIKEFLINHPKATIINLGAGLDTTFYRIDNGLLNWYDIDLPEVIKIRKKLIPETERVNYIEDSIFEMQWVKNITNTKDGLLFISNGVLEYFQEILVKKFLLDIANLFPESEIIFNTVRKNIISSFVNRRMMKKLGMKSATTKWGIKDIEKIKQWDTRIVILENYPLFSKIKRQKNWDENIIKAMKRFDKWKAITMVHLKFK